MNCDERGHLWTCHSPMRCVRCGRYLLSWWRRTRLKLWLWWHQ